MQRKTFQIWMMKTLKMMKFIFKDSNNNKKKKMKMTQFQIQKKINFWTQAKMVKCTFSNNLILMIVMKEKQVQIWNQIQIQIKKTMTVEFINESTQIIKKFLFR